MNQAAVKRFHEFVASLPCANCGLFGCSQAAHYQGFHGHLFGRGGSIKAHDLMVAPLCCERSGSKYPCHTKTDNYKINQDIEDRHMRKIANSELFLTWIMQTIIAAYKAGILKVGE